MARTLIFAGYSLASAAAACISLKDSTQCPAFNASSITTDLASTYPFLAFVASVDDFDKQLQQYVGAAYVQTRYQQSLGCNVDLTNTTHYYARYTTSVLCNSIVQNSVDACALRGQAAEPLCAETCATSEEAVAINPALCKAPRPGYLDQIRADFTSCALPANSLTTECILGAHNQPDNCGFSSNLQGLCAFCAGSSPNATDSCCASADTARRCPGVTLPSITSVPPLFSPTFSPTSSPTAAVAHGLSGGAIAGIVIGSVVGALLIAALALLCCVYWRRRRQNPRLVASTHKGESSHSSGPTSDIAIKDPVGGRVARMSALETSSEDHSENEAGNYDVAGLAKPYTSSDSDRDMPRPQAGRRQGSRSSQSVLGALEDPDSTEGPSGSHSEQLPFFKDYYSQDEIHANDKVSVLWAYQPRASDEFELERGDMLKVVGIWDDGWATGVRIHERAEDFDRKRSAFRDSGVSATSPAVGSFPEQGELKAFPLVCVCLPEHWKPTLQEGEER